MAKNQTRSEWITEQLNKHGLAKVKNSYTQFLNNYPGSSYQSFIVSVNREARTLKTLMSKSTIMESALAKELTEQAEDREKNSILSAYSLYVKNNKDIPTINVLGFQKHRIAKLFGSMNDLYNIARKRYPHRFKDIVDYKVWSKQRHNKTKDYIKKYNRFVITTAVSGCPVDLAFLEAIKKYCKMHKATLLIFVADQLDEVDPILKDENIVFDNISINNNLHLDTIKILPKALDPITGVDRIATREGSFIFGSTKQRLVYVPTGIPGKKLPYANMTTGAITLPIYMSQKYYQKRTDKLAEIDHKMGAIIVETKNDKTYHFRQIQWTGEFVDLGISYPTLKKVNSKISAGDWHVGDTDPKVEQGIYDLANRINCKSIILHDLFNGHSISHHEKNNSVNRAISFKQGRLILKDELNQYVEALNTISKHFDQIEIVRSNHDEFISKYINEDMYIRDPFNIRTAWELCIAQYDGYNPLEWWSKNSGKLIYPNKIEWLKETDERFYGDIKYSDHGHRGPNGSRGNLKSLEKTNAKAVYGHSHTAQIMRETWQNGTSTKRDLDYVKGPSSWTLSSTIIYENGHRQLINFNDGEYTTMPK